MIFTFNSYTCLLYNYWKNIQGCIPCRIGRSLYHIENHSSSDYYSYGRNLFQKSHQHTLQDEILALRVYLCNTNVSLAFSLRQTFVLKAYDTSIGIEFRTQVFCIRKLTYFWGKIINTWFEVVVESMFIHNFFKVIGQFIVNLPTSEYILGICIK